MKIYGFEITEEADGIYKVQQGGDMLLLSIQELFLLENYIENIREEYNGQS